MKIPNQTALLALETHSLTNIYSHQVHTENVEGNYILPQITYVSPRHKNNIIDGQYDPCPGRRICWGTGKHAKGYECCHPTQQICSHTPTGRPQCSPNKLAAALVVNRKLAEKGMHEPGLNRMVANYI